MLARSLVISVALLTFSAPAAADTAGDVKLILGALAKAKIINPKIVDASDLIYCFAMQSPEQCVDLQDVGDQLASDAASDAEKKAAEFIPSDPMVQTAVDIVRAVIQDDWLRVLELAGVKLLGQISCTASLAVTGPLEPFICGSFADEVLSKADPLVHEILVVVKDFPNVNLWKLITLFGFELACDMAEDYGVPLAGEACGVLGEAVEAIANFSKAALDAIGQGAEALAGALADGAEAVVEFVFGSGDGPNALDPEIYYAHIVRPTIYTRVSERLNSGATSLGMNNAQTKSCTDHYGSTIGSYVCPVLSNKLKGEAEILYKYVLTIPETYFDGWLKARTRDRVRYRYHSDEFQAYRGYIDKLSLVDTTLFLNAQTNFVRGYNPIPTQIPPQNRAEYFSYYLPRLTDCLSVVNGLFDVEGQWTREIEDWVCFEAVGKRFANALVAEKSRIAKSIIPQAKAFGCKSTKVGDSPELMFICQSYAAIGACLNLAREEYEGNHFCTLDKPQAGMRLGIELVTSLTAERCVYLYEQKSGPPNPRVACSRPWKRKNCEALLQSYRVRWGIEDLSIRMQCVYFPDKNFLEQEARAKQIVAALNGTPVVELAPDIGRRTLPPSLNSTLCRTLWDPLAINCPHQTKMPPLPDDLATPPIESCPADPNKNGADRVCYQVVFTHKDQLREKENQPLSPAKAVPQMPPSPAGPVRTGTVSRQPVPSPIATTGAATELPGAAAQSAPVVTTMSRTPPGQPEPDPAAAPVRTAAPAIRAMNAKPDAKPAPPNPCRMTVNYYVPEAPVVSAIASRLLVNDQFQIQCSFKKVAREVDWPECDDAARTSMQLLKLSEESGGRYSGIVAIDGNTVGVSSSPEDGSDFVSTKTWTFDDPGAHDVSCQIDNAFHYAAEGAPTYLNSDVALDVSARADGLTFRLFEPESASILSVKPLPSEAVPTARDGRFRMLQDAAPAGSDRLRQQAILGRELPNVRTDTGGISVGDLLGASLVDREVQETFLSRYLEREGSTEEFWQNLEENDQLDRDTIEELQTTFYIARLTRDNLPLLLSLRDLRSSGVLKSWHDVAAIDEGLWQKLILTAGGESGITLPPDIPGSTPEERLKNYIFSLREGIEALYPSDSLRHTLQKPSDTKTGIQNFLRNVRKVPQDEAPVRRGDD